MNQTALFSGLTYRRLEMIRGLDDATYVLCESENGERFVCPLDRWEAAAPAPTTKVHSKSSSQDKIALFLERFRGREDVYETSGNAASAIRKNTAAPTAPTGNSLLCLPESSVRT